MKTKSPGPRQVTQTFKLLDKNRDGKINFEEIKEVLSDMFPNEQLQDGKRTILGDPSGNSISVGFFFDFDSRDRIQLECSDLDENFRIKNNMTDELNISINSAEIVDWFLN